MRNQKAIRCVLVPVALIVLLVFVTTLGSVWHHHAHSSEANCSICHVNHQPMERPLASDRTPALAQLEFRPEPSEPAFAPSPLAPRLPARAPPAV
ncbi:MAG TPA: hypothetical protein VN861_12605 [Candidatus Acidoferrales bacterium]|nr:hypothetical protein [Candidatus Acidoferrales bacterium]